MLVIKDKDDFYEEYHVLKLDKKVKHGSYLRLSKFMLHEYALESVGYYSDGMKNGYWESYYKNVNNVRDKGYYKKDLRDSTWVFYYPEGIKRKLTEVQSKEGISLQVIDSNPVVLKKGKYKNGKVSGIWEYFDPDGALHHKYDHDSDSLYFLNSDNIANIDAGPIEGDFLLHQHLYDTFDLDGLMNMVNTKISLESGKIILSFTIDESGNVNDIREMENTIRVKKISDRAVMATHSLDKKYYSRKENGIPRPTTKTITFDLQVNMTHHSSITDKWFFSNTAKAFSVRIKVE